ncbi:hypothetical protein JO861_22220 [Rhodococcus hoagii]|uniref:hypothetical protein n=1 Tax=Rhodococcus hoagii TaxID=43767 RepID=UPI0019653DB9|nr:hypothetical protein [Prescottella equi]MBM9839268.1 hypothetical protein [Prescottella equi]
MAAPTDPDATITALLHAYRAYPSLATGAFYDEILTEVQDRVARAGSLGKADLGALLLWKRLNLSARWTRALNELPDAEVRTVTGRAYEVARDGDRPIPEAAGEALAVLRMLPGCRHGAAVASTVLTAGAPDRMAVYDRRAATALKALGYSHPNGDYGRFMATVCELTAAVNGATGTKWCPRDVDKALFILGGNVGAGTPS